MMFQLNSKEYDFAVNASLCNNKSWIFLYVYTVSFEYHENAIH